MEWERVCNTLHNLQGVDLFPRASVSLKRLCSLLLL